MSSKATKKPAAAAANGGAENGLLGPYLSGNGDWSVVPPSVKEQIFHCSQTNMEKLFGEAAAAGFMIEQSLIWFSDDVQPNGQHGVDLDWYISPDPESKKGTRAAIEPSPHNRDLQEQTCEEYKQRLLAEGQPQSVAGSRDVLAESLKVDLLINLSTYHCHDHDNQFFVL